MKNRAHNNVIVVGSSHAGMMAALAASYRGCRVTIVSPLPLRRSADACCQDGIAGVVYPAMYGDSAELHMRDTIAGGDYLADEAAVGRMCQDAPRIIRLCRRMGVPFNRTNEGRLRQLASAGMGAPRVVFADTATGQYVVNAFDEQVRRLAGNGAIERRERLQFCSLVLDGKGICRGIIGVDVQSLEVEALPADAVIMCTGGYSGIYASSTSPLGNAGMELAQVHMQGAVMANPEFVQFHPTAMPGADKPRPIGEMVRALGARLWVSRNERLWAFLEEGAGAAGNNVPYDWAARAVDRVTREMSLGVDGERLVHLDLGVIDQKEIESTVPRMLDCAYRYAGVDALREPVSVGVAAHMTLGGLWVDNRHMTTVPGLFAAGGCVCRYHGANALGSNVMLASIHGGAVAGESAAEYVNDVGSTADVVASVFEAEKEAQEGEIKRYTARDEGENPRVIGGELGDIMDRCVGVMRDRAGLEEAQQVLADLGRRFAVCRPADRSAWSNPEVLYMRTLARQLYLAKLTVSAALAREETRGVHARADFLKRDDKRWRVVTKAVCADGEPQFDYRETVRSAVVQPEKREFM